jgi:hypothetical protein
MWISKKFLNTVRQYNGRQSAFDPLHHLRGLVPLIKRIYANSLEPFISSINKLNINSISRHHHATKFRSSALEKISPVCNNEAFLTEGGAYYGAAQSQ